MEKPRTSVVLRWVAAGLMGGGGMVVLARLFRGEESVPLIGRSLLGIVAIIAGAVLVAPEIVRWIVTPISNLLDSILLPSEKIHPPVDFTLARFYGQSGRYDEACEEYEKILHYHPDNEQAHLEGIRAAALAGNETLAKKFYQRARRLLPDGDNKRQELDAVYAARNQPLEGNEEAGAELEPESSPETLEEPPKLPDEPAP